MLLKAELGLIENVESGVVIDLMLSYRSRKAFKQMIQLIEKMSPELQPNCYGPEQYALALNREKQPGKAERVLLELIKKRGPSSETYGILGRVYKDQWEQASKAGDDFLAQGTLDKAIEAYLKRFRVGLAGCLSWCQRSHVDGASRSSRSPPKRDHSCL